MDRRDFFKQLAIGGLIASGPTIFIPRFTRNIWPQKMIYGPWLNGSWLNISGFRLSPAIHKNFNLPLSNAAVFELKENLTPRCYKYIMDKIKEYSFHGHAGSIGEPDIRLDGPWSYEVGWRKIIKENGEAFYTNLTMQYEKLG